MDAALSKATKIAASVDSQAMDRYLCSQRRIEYHHEDSHLLDMVPRNIIGHVVAGTAPVNLSHSWFYRAIPTSSAFTSANIKALSALVHAISFSEYISKARQTHVRNDNPDLLSILILTTRAPNTGKYDPIYGTVYRSRKVATPKELEPLLGYIGLTYIAVRADSFRHGG